MPFGQIAVGPVPVQVCPPLGDGEALNIYNQDELNIVSVGDSYSISQGGSNTAPIQPLTNAVIPATKAVFAVAPAGTADLVIVPDGGTISPSPAQVAIQIAALGLAKESTQLVNVAHTGTTATNVAAVNTTLGTPSQDPTVAGLNTGIPNNIAVTGAPPLALSQIFVNPGVQTFTTLQSRTYMGPTINQMSVEVFIALSSNAAETSPYFKCTFQWSESVSGQIVDTADYWLAGGSAQQNIYVGTIRAKGDTLTVTIVNEGTLTSGNCQLVVSQCSRTYVRDTIKSDSFTGFPGTPNASPYPVRTNAIFGTSPTVTVATPAQRAMPMYVGTVRITAFTTTGTANIAVLAPVPIGLNDNTVWQQTIPANTQINSQFDLPRGNCTLIITNTGASAQQIGVCILISEQDV